MRVTSGKATAPARLASFNIEIEVLLELSDEHRRGIEDVVHRCLIHNTLLYPPQITL